MAKFFKIIKNDLSVTRGFQRYQICGGYMLKIPNSSTMAFCPTVHWSRSRDVKWNPRNGGKACLEDEKESFSDCNRKCCRKYICTLETIGRY